MQTNYIVYFRMQVPCLLAFKVLQSYLFPLTSQKCSLCISGTSSLCDDQLGASPLQMTENFHDAKRLRQVLQKSLDSHPVKARDVGLHWSSCCPSLVGEAQCWSTMESSPAWHPPSQGTLRWRISPPSREFKGSLSLFGKFEEFCLYVHFIATTWNGGEAPPFAHLPAVVCKTKYTYKHKF